MNKLAMMSMNMIFIFDFFSETNKQKVNFQKYDKNHVFEIHQKHNHG